VNLVGFCHSLLSSAGFSEGDKNCPFVFPHVLGKACYMGFPGQNSIPYLKFWIVVGWVTMS